MANRKVYIICLVALLLGLLSMTMKKSRPTIYIIGDSTVRNKHEAQQGWGDHLARYLDTSKVRVDNQAMAGRSTRTFMKEGRWHRVDSLLKPGDYVLMQFGHNDGSRPDTSRAGYRGTLPGTGEDTLRLVWPSGEVEIVRTYGWYIRQFIRQAKAKGAVPIVLSMIPRNQWKEGKVLRADESFGKWAREVAEQEQAFFIDLNRITADKYDEMGPDQVKDLFYNDHTHTNAQGATINAQSVIEGIKKNKQIEINAYVKK